jgi:hypothetical protein
MPWLVTEGTSLPSAIVAAFLVFLSLGIGRRLLVLLGARGPVTPLERGVIAIGLGAGALQFVPFALGALGFLTSTSLYVVTALLVIAVAPDLWAVSVAGIAAVRQQTRPSGWTIAWIIALCPALLLVALVALAPSFDEDGLVYHLTVPKRWMYTGRLDYLPTYPYSNAPMGMEMLFGLAMAFTGDVAAKCLHFALGLVAAVAIYLAGRRLASRMVGAVPATLFLVGPGGAAAYLGFAYVEGAAALATAGSALSWLIWYQLGNRGYLLSAALLAGIAVSFKITVAVFPAALLALTAIVVAVRALHQQHSLSRGASALAGMSFSASLITFVVIPMLPWCARAFLITGNPLYPLFANIIPSRDLPADLASKIDQFYRYMTWGNVIGRDWTLQERFWVLLGVAVIWSLLGALAFYKLRGGTKRGAAVVLTIAGLVQLSAAGLYMRYWLPIAAVLMIPMAAAIASVLSRRAVMLAWLGLTLLGSLAVARSSYISLGSNFAMVMRSISGRDERVHFLRSQLPIYPLYEVVNRDLSPDARIMLSGYCAGFYVDRSTFCAEMVQSSLRFTTWEEFTEDLRRLRITHLIAPSTLATGGPTPDLGSDVSVITRAGQYRLVRQLLTSNARTIATASDLGLYEISPVLKAGP